MTLSEYQAFVEQMASDRSKRDLDSRFQCAALGLAGEAGEFADLVKKAIYHEAGPPLDKMLKELGDVLWYAAFAANALGMSLERVIEMNVTKLRDRYKTGTFTVAEFQAKEAAKGP